LRIQTTLFLHAGCPASGRLGQLHSLDLKTLEWSRLPDAPGAGRGGTVLTSLPPLNGNSFLARFGGFAGHELDGLDIYDVAKKEWKSVEVEGESKPEKRSVYVFVGLDVKLEHDGKSVVGVLALGEREGAPAELGHNGAGFVSSNIFASHSSSPRMTDLASSSRSSSTMMLGLSSRRKTKLALDTPGLNSSLPQTPREFPKLEVGYLLLICRDQRSSSKAVSMRRTRGCQMPGLWRS
jgi:hypothetical protein